MAEGSPCKVLQISSSENHRGRRNGVISSSRSPHGGREGIATELLGGEGQKVLKKLSSDGQRLFRPQGPARFSAKVSHAKRIVQWVRRRGDQTQIRLLIRPGNSSDGRQEKKFTSGD